MIISDHVIQMKNAAQIISIQVALHRINIITKQIKPLILWKMEDFKEHLKTFH